MELTKKDVIGMLTMMKCNYPYAYKDQTEKETSVLVNTWFTILGKYPKEVVQTAFYKCLEICKQPPTIADISEQINKFEDANTPSESELWAGLEKAVRQVARVTYFGNQAFFDGSKGEMVQPQQKLNEIFNCLDPLLKEYIGNPETLKSISKLETLEYEKNRFNKVLPTIKQRQKIRQEINPNILKLVSGDTLRLEDKRGEDESNND